MTEHSTNLIFEMSLLNNKIDIKVYNLVKVQLNELEEHRLEQDKRRNVVFLLDRYHRSM